MKSICTDIDGHDKLIKEAIDLDLAGDYNIAAKVINFKDYGNPSSRTRTLVIGVRKDQKEITPLELFPDRQEEQTLRQTIGHLPHLHYMGEIWDQDIYHTFRPYAPHMVSWIENITEGQSAFDNEDESRIPHHEKDGEIIYNQRKNGDKYTRQYWDKVPPCVHTRNDIMASQNTVHPTDNRVFSIREVMLMMSVPQSFEWSAIPYAQLNALPLEEKQKYLKKEDPNIRQSLGEAVPTIIFQQIAQKIKGKVAESELTEHSECSDGRLPAALVEKGETVFLPTQNGEFMFTPFRDLTTGLEHVALTKGEWTPDEPVLCRVHSSCITGDIFGSRRCECGEQLSKAMQMIEAEGKGILVYMNQEGRGIGLMNKIRAYKLQEQGDDTVEANIHLGFRPDERDYGVGAQILREMGVHKLRLMTNNPVKRVGLESYGIESVENVPIEIQPNRWNERYMRTKKEKMHHELKLV